MNPCFPFLKGGPAVFFESLDGVSVRRRKERRRLQNLKSDQTAVFLLQATSFTPRPEARKQSIRCLPAQTPVSFTLRFQKLTEPVDREQGLRSSILGPTQFSSTDTPADAHPLLPPAFARTDAVDWVFHLRSSKSRQDPEKHDQTPYPPSTGCERPSKRRSKPLVWRPHLNQAHVEVTDVGPQERQLQRLQVDLARHVVALPTGEKHGVKGGERQRKGGHILQMHESPQILVRKAQAISKSGVTGNTSQRRIQLRMRSGQAARIQTSRRLKRNDTSHERRVLALTRRPRL
jgi:hypothetical protein